jgi:hypothetical protein
MVFKFGWGARRITGGMYIALGWAGVFIFPAATRDAGQTAMVLLGIGGVLYTMDNVKKWIAEGKFMDGKTDLIPRPASVPLPGSVEVLRRLNLGTFP